MVKYNKMKYYFAASVCALWVQSTRISQMPNLCTGIRTIDLLAAIH